MGDWNIAPQDDDVWDIEFFRANAMTHVSEPERAAFHAFETAGFKDVVRPHTPSRRLHLLGLHPAAFPQEGRHAD
ncbi:exodeoxyribonuclease III [Arthrobacter sp. Hiyo6]|nr:exodeoxyribonuclease III [Arthrobacter sp. Hiyo6]